MISIIMDLTIISDHIYAVNVNVELVNVNVSIERLNFPCFRKYEY